jgi:hypothetical protein
MLNVAYLVAYASEVRVPQPVLTRGGDCATVVAPPVHHGRGAGDASAEKPPVCPLFPVFSWSRTTSIIG